MSEHVVTKVGPEWFYDMDDALAGGCTEGELEAAAVFTSWIRGGFPDEVNVGASSVRGSLASFWMTASDLVEAATKLLTTPLPMPDELADKVREYVSQTPIENEVSEQGALPYMSAIFDLKMALAVRQEQAQT